MVEGRREEEWKGKESRKIYSSIKISNKKKRTGFIGAFVPALQVIFYGVLHSNCCI